MKPIATFHIRPERRSRLSIRVEVYRTTTEFRQAVRDEDLRSDRRASRERDLLRGLSSFSYVLGIFARYRDLHGTPAFRGPGLARVRFERRPNSYHWIAFINGSVHDPALSRALSHVQYARYLRRQHGRITSYAPVEHIG
jgi:hypothetical protein